MRAICGPVIADQSIGPNQLADLRGVAGLDRHQEGRVLPQLARGASGPEHPRDVASPHPFGQRERRDAALPLGIDGRARFEEHL